MATLDIIVKPKLKFSLKKCGEVVPYGITPEEKAKLAGIEENANNYTHPETHPSSILDVVDVVGGAANKFLNERGEMVAVATSSIGVTGSQLYASTANSDVEGYKSLVGTPQTSETEITLTAKSSNGIVWGDKYLSAPFTEAVTIPATAYGFDYWRKVSASNGASRKHLRMFIYRAGVETNISTPLVSPDIDETDFTERQISYIFPELALLAGDRIGIQEGFSTTHANNVTLTYIVGDGRGWFMRLPLPLKHESLTDKNSEAAFQHIDTTTTKETLVAADKVALYDSVTGKMVLTPKSGLAGNTNLLYEYVHSGNKEVYISSIDYATNTFTSVNHGLVNGDRLGLKIISDGIIEKVIPFTDAIPQDSDRTGYFVINATLDTFQISATSGGAAITTINKATQDFSKWRFEVLIAQNISLPNIPSIGCEIEVIGDIMQLHRYVNENSYRSLSTGYVQQAVTSTALVHANTYLLKGWYRISIRKTGTSMFVNRKYVGIQLDTTNSARIKWVTAEIIMLTNGDISLIDNILLTSAMLTNGTIINVYKI